MKKTLLIALSLITLGFGSATAQTFIPDSGNNDTVTHMWSTPGTSEVHNNIRSASSTPVTLKWRVIYSNFAAGWSESTSGICDNASCRSNITTLASNLTWETSDPYSSTASLFDVQFASTNPAPGTKSTVTVQIMDAAGTYSRTLTFIEYRASLSVPTPGSFENVTMYPNPAVDFLNVLYDARAGVTNIGIYNLIGKNIQNYKVSNNTSAKLDLDNIPAGVYFIRLVNAQGQIVATRRFTRQ